MDDQARNEHPDTPEEEVDYTPFGAIFVATFVAVTIVLGWFGVFFLSLQRG